MHLFVFFFNVHSHNPLYTNL